MKVSETVRVHITLSRTDIEWCERNNKRLSEILTEHIAALRRQFDPEAAMKRIDVEIARLDEERRQLEAFSRRKKADEREEGEFLALVSRVVAGEYGRFATPPLEVVRAIWADMLGAYNAEGSWSGMFRIYPDDAAKVGRTRKAWNEAQTKKRMEAVLKATPSPAPPSPAPETKGGVA